MDIARTGTAVTVRHVAMEFFVTGHPSTGGKSCRWKHRKEHPLNGSDNWDPKKSRTITASALWRPDLANPANARPKHR